MRNLTQAEIYIISGGASQDPKPDQTPGDEFYPLRPPKSIGPSYKPYPPKPDVPPPRDYDPTI